MFASVPPQKTEERTRHSSRFSLRYPWAMAPTINTTKPVATAIATFVSIDKFMIFPFNYGSDPVAPFLIFFLFLHPFEVQRADGCRRQVRSKKQEEKVRNRSNCGFGLLIADFEWQLSHRGPKVFGDTNYRERKE
jgi:hypothetical protein